MSKDPAFLFYPGDWLGGTQLFTRAHKGAYMDVLMAQYANGHLPIDDIRALLGSDFDTMWEQRLKAKFKVDENGLFYNEKLEKTMEDRKRFTASRVNNLSGKKKEPPHMDSHKEPHTVIRMENGNEDLNKKGEKNERIKTPENFEAVEVISYLNELNGTRFRTDTKQTIKLIGQRIKEGFDVAELKQIIEYKVGEWKGTKDEKWLQPDTLFAGDNCAKYRNQVQAAKDKGMTLGQIRAIKPNTVRTKEQMWEEYQSAQAKKYAQQ